MKRPCRTEHTHTRALVGWGEREVGMSNNQTHNHLPRHVLTLSLRSPQTARTAASPFPEPDIPSDTGRDTTNVREPACGESRDSKTALYRNFVLSDEM